MQLVVLVAFVVSFGLVDLLASDPQGAAAALRTPPAMFLSAVGGYLLVAGAMAWLNTRLSLRRLAGQADLPPRALRRHHLLAVATGVWLAAGLAGVLLAGYGRWLVEDLHLSGVPLAPKLLAVAPFLAAVELVWLLDYPYYRAIRRRIWAGRDDAPCWSPAEYLDYNTRHHVLFIAVPVALIVLGVDLLALAAPALDRALPAPAGQIVHAAGSFAVAGAVFLLAPLLIVRVWRTERLPDGPLRARLRDTCVRLGLRVRDLRVWRSGGQIVNAAVMGLAAPVRYVLLTDALLEHLDERGVEAVFAHEAGHIVSHHIFYSVLLVLSAAVGCAALAELAAGATGLGPWVSDLLAVAMLAGAWGLGFGWVSRRFERQCDVQAAWAMSGAAPRDRAAAITPEGAATFAWALQQIARLNGIAPEQFNWRHGSIARRVEHVLWLGATGGTRQAIDRTVRRIKAALWLAAGAAAALTAWSFFQTA